VSLLAAQRTGTGPRPVVLLHGFLGSARNLGGLARGLAGRDPTLSVVSFDLPGHGGSPPLAVGADLGSVAEAVLEAVRAVGIAGPVPIVGHSLGGRVALRAGARSPEAVAHVALLDISPAGRPPHEETAAIVDALVRAPATGASRGAFREWFRDAGVSEPIADWLLLNLEMDGATFRWRIDRAALADLHPRITGEDLWPIVESPRPWSLTCVRGARSSYVADADARRLEAAGCPITTVDAGHFLHAERAAEVAAHVLQSLTPSPSR
jgi:esterase